MAEAKNSTDRRVIKTKKAIRNAFARLLSEKELADITISDIAGYADINRKTFYNYYSGIHEVVDEIENEIASSFDEVLGDMDFSRDIEEPYHIFEKLTSIINTDIDFYGHMFSMRGNVSMMTKIVDLMKEKARPTVVNKLGISEEKADILMEYSFSGMIAVYQRWFNSDRRGSIEDISATIGKISAGGIKELLED